VDSKEFADSTSWFDQPDQVRVYRLKQLSEVAVQEIRHYKTPVLVAREPRIKFAEEKHCFRKIFD